MQRGLTGASAQKLAGSARKQGTVTRRNVVAFQRAIIVRQGHITCVKSNRATVLAVFPTE